MTPTPAVKEANPLERDKSRAFTVVNVATVAVDALL